MRVNPAPLKKREQEGVARGKKDLSSPLSGGNCLTQKKW